MSEIVFIVEEAAEGGYPARALGVDIVDSVHAIRDEGFRA